MEDGRYRAIVEKHFRVYDTRKERLPGGTAHMFFLMFPKEELEQRFDAARQELLGEDRDLIVFLRRDGGEDILVIAPRAPVLDKSAKVNWILLAATILTTMASGAIYWQGYRYADEPFTWAALLSPGHLLWGFVLFTVPLMTILGIHEAAHYIAARRHGLRASLPFFIPFPPIFLPIGTLGAFISMRDPLPDRKALFDVGASGPIAGLLIAIPVILLGAVLTDAEAIPVPDHDRPEVNIDADALLDTEETGRVSLVLESPAAGTRVVEITAPDDDWTYTMVVDVTVAEDTLSDTSQGKLGAGETSLRTVTIPENATHAEVRIEWDDGLVRFGDPLLIKGINALGLGNGDYLTHPTYFAGWIGVFVTGLNLIPASQLDGGHVARAILGDRMRYAAYAAVGVLFYLAFAFQTWLLLAILILFMGVNHPPPLNDRVPLDPKRRVMAGITILVLIVTFVPQPFLF